MITFKEFLEEGAALTPYQMFLHKVANAYIKLYKVSKEKAMDIVTGTKSGNLQYYFRAHIPPIDVAKELGIQ